MEIISIVQFPLLQSVIEFAITTPDKMKITNLLFVNVPFEFMSTITSTTYIPTLKTIIVLVSIPFILMFPTIFKV